MRSERRSLPEIVAVLLAGVVLLAGLAGCSVDSEALRNVIAYRWRRTFPPLIVSREPQVPASLAGTVRDQQGHPIDNAVVLVSTVRGEVYQARTDTQGNYRIGGIPAGRYVPLAGAWRYVEATGESMQVTPGSDFRGLDFVLSPHDSDPVVSTDLQVGPPAQAYSAFPTPTVATRFPFTFTLDGQTVNGGQIYLPEGQKRPPQTTLVMVYPSAPLNWDAASVALTGTGHSILAVGPDGDRGLDIDAHARDFRAALELWRSGQLAPLHPPADRWVAMSGSFGSLIFFRALQDLPQMPPALVNVGGVSDAFLGVQSLYSEDLAIPPPYDSAIAAMGRPDRDPGFFYRYSPVFFAEQLSPVFVIHTYEDEVIPYNQALALKSALSQAGVPHEFLLYHDTTHYLDAYQPTEATFMVYDRVLEWVDRFLGTPAAIF
jgi:hypothetical protein